MRGGMWKSRSAPTKPGPTATSHLQSRSWEWLFSGMIFILVPQGWGEECWGDSQVPSEVVWMHQKVTHWEKPHLCISECCGKLWQDGSLTGIIVCINTLVSRASWEAYRQTFNRSGYPFCSSLVSSPWFMLGTILSPILSRGLRWSFPASWSLA